LERRAAPDGAARIEDTEPATLKMKVMKTRIWNLKRGLATALGCLTLACTFWGPGFDCRAQSDPANLPPGVQDVLKLTRAGLSEDLILSQVRTSGTTYNLTADQIIYLSNQGVSQNVIKALLPTGGSAPSAPAWQPAPASAAASYAPAPPAPAYVPPPPAPAYTPAAEVVAAPAQPAPPPVSFDYFQAQLQPYGRWVNVSGVGLCWVPAECADPSWRPYFNSGHWVYTDQGWFWQSDYAWGEIPFHYGRWFRDLNYGWVWAPGYDWAPAWVCWRYAQADGCCGWAPLPLEARFDLRLGLCWRGGVALDVDFGLPVDAFVFIGFGNFWVHDYRTVVFARDRVRVIFARSVIHNGYRMDHGRFVCDGFGRERMAQLTRHDVRAVAAHELRATEERQNIEKRVAQHPKLAETAQRHVAAAATRTVTRTSATETRATPAARREATPTRTATTSEHTLAPNRTPATAERTTTTPGRTTTATTEHATTSGRSAATTEGGSTRTSFTESHTATTTARTSGSTPTTRTVPSTTPTRATMNSSASRSALGSGSSAYTSSGQTHGASQGSAYGTANPQSRSATYGGSSGSQRGVGPSSGGSSRQPASSDKSSNQGGK
jgi:hypothetical protein